MESTENWGGFDFYIDVKKIEGIKSINYMEQFDFSCAMQHIKNGIPVRRSFWAPEAFVVMMPSLNLPPANTQVTERKVNDRTSKWIGEDKPLNCLPYIAFYTAKEEWQPGWVPSQMDMFAEDWVMFKIKK